jgi:hypothetical protein
MIIDGSGAPRAAIIHRQRLRQISPRGTIRRCASRNKLPAVCSRGTEGSNPSAESRANRRFLRGGAHVPHSRALRPRHLGDTRRGRTRRHGERVAQTRGQRQVGLLVAGSGRLITTSGPKSAVVLESSLADNIASPANDIERGGLLRIANPNRRGKWQSCGKTALVSFGRSRR